MMAIATDLAASVAALADGVTNSAPLKQASQILIEALQQEGARVLARIESDLAASGGVLDADDPTGFAGEMVADLERLAGNANDQTTLCDLRGLVGRAMFNLAQVPA